MRQSILTPISIIGSGTLLIAVLLFQPSAGSRAAPQNDITDYPGPTQTAMALANSTTNAYPGATTTVAATTTAATTATTSTVTTATSWAGITTTPTTNTLTATPFQGGGFATPTPRVLYTPQPISPTPTQEALIATPTPSDGSRVCMPGETVTIIGEGPANAGFLVYFGSRVVSGGTVRRDGSFSVSLTMGSELSGSYRVDLRIRGSNELLTSITCLVPATTPTPLPDRSQGGEGR